MIYYERPDQAGPKQSIYVITPTADPAGLKTALRSALGERGVVEKVRTLYLAGQTRIHIDEVAKLGWFMELEVVLRPDQTPMDRLGIAADDLIDGAYLDLLND